MRSFVIAVADAVLDDLRVRLDRTRPARGGLAGWSAGTDPGYLASFVTSWAGAYQWRDTESVLNGLPQMLVSVAGTDNIHVFRVRARTPAPGTAPVPLILTHGWPSSFFEFLPVIGPLTDPAAHGGEPADAFDVVIPSLPGFGFSGPLPAGQNHPARIADLWAGLMGHLGYRRFGACGGDIGSHVTNFLGARHPGRLIGIFTHHPALHPRLDGGRPLSAAEGTSSRSNSPPASSATSATSTGHYVPPQLVTAGDGPDGPRMSTAPRFRRRPAQLSLPGRAGQVRRRRASGRPARGRKPPQPPGRSAREAASRSRGRSSSRHSARRTRPWRRTTGAPGMPLWR
jgi:epoxide hydrolase